MCAEPYNSSKPSSRCNPRLKKSRCYEYPRCRANGHLAPETVRLSCFCEVQSRKLTTLSVGLSTDYRPQTSGSILPDGLGPGLCNGSDLLVSAFAGLSDPRRFQHVPVRRLQMRCLIGPQYGICKVNIRPHQAQNWIEVSLDGSFRCNESRDD